MTKSKTQNPNCSCLVCNKDIYKKPSVIKKNNGKVYCSMKCYGLQCRREVPCLVCGKLILSTFNKKTCSRTCSNMHREGIKYKIGRPKNKATTARYIKLELFRKRGTKCERCGYNVEQVLHVHHKNRNRQDNSRDNLEIICPNCHYEEHYKNK